MTNQLELLAKRIRYDILRSTTAAGSGHPTSSLSAVELMVALMFGGTFRADLRRPGYFNNDRLIFSKGHAAPLLYALYAAAGVVKPAEILKLRTFGSRLEGHPMPVFPYVDIPTGSLGQGLSVGLGMAVSATMDRLPFRTFVLLGDSEMAEGQVWEAMQLAAFRKVSNLVAILDVNRLGQSGPTMWQYHLATYAQRAKAFGWLTIVVDGHDLNRLQTAYRQATETTGRPIMIIAKTIKGRGVSWLENRNGWHGRTLTPNELRRALRELGPVESDRLGTVKPPKKVARPKAVTKAPTRLTFPRGSAISPRQAFGQGLVNLAKKYPRLVVVDGEVMNSTMTEEFGRKFPRRFIEGYIAEQNMISLATGLASRGWLPVSATFAAFLTRAHDQLRLAQYAGLHQLVVGTHVGVHVGPDGPSQMGLEDIALFRSLPDATVLYPADAVSTNKLLDQGLRQPGLVYLRLTRAALPNLYPIGTAFPMGGSQTVRSSRRDVITIVAAGVTLHQAIQAADQLAKRRMAVRVIDLYSIKPIDTPTLKRAAHQTKRLLVVEDHYPEGGIAEAVRTALGPLAGQVVSLAVTKQPRSGRPEQLLAYEGLDAASIVRSVQRLLKP